MKKFLGSVLMIVATFPAIALACGQGGGFDGIQEFNFDVRYQSTYDFWDTYTNGNNYEHTILSIDTSSPFSPDLFQYVGPPSWNVPGNSTLQLVRANGITIDSTDDFQIDYMIDYSIPSSSQSFSHIECAYYDVTYCGDGVTDTPGAGDSWSAEACDDGNNVNGDGCENNCTVTPQQPVECISSSLSPATSIDVGDTYTVTCDGNNETAFDVSIRRNGSAVGTFAMSPSGSAWSYSYTPTQAGSYQFTCIAKNPTASPSSDSCAVIGRIVEEEPVCGDGSINQPNEECDNGGQNGNVCNPPYG